MTPSAPASGPDDADATNVGGASPDTATAAAMPEATATSGAAGRTVSGSPLRDGPPMGAVVGALLVLILGLVLTLSGMLWNRNRVAAEAQLQLDAQMARLERDIVQRFAQPIYGLKGARGAIASLQGHVDRAAFRAYVQSRDLPREFPGVRGFGFVLPVMRDRLDAFIAAERADGAPQFSVRTRGDAPDLYVVAHVEPLSQNYPAWGFDLGSEQVRRTAIEAAIRTGEAQMTTPIALIQDRARGPGVILLVPVFREGADPVDPIQRRKALLGLLYAPLVAQEILAGLKEGMARAPIDFRLMVDDQSQAEDLLLDSSTGIHALHTRPETVPGFERRLVSAERRMTIIGRDFRLEGAMNTAYERRVIDAAGWWPGLIGILLTTLLAVTTYLLAAGRARAQALADAMTEDLRRLTLDQQAMLDADILGIAKLHDRRIVWRNRALERLFGYGEGEMLGLPVRDLYADEAAFLALGQNAYPLLERGGHYRSQQQMRRKDGELVWIDLNGVALPSEREADTTLWMMVDITHSKAYEARVERAAFHDALTGLPNRVLLADRLRQAIAAAARQELTVGVVYLDLDGFKAVNDTHGHDAGDEVLQAVARRLRDGIRASDTAARLGGDEFVVLLTPLPTRDDSANVCERLLRAILEPVRLSTGALVQVGSSIGVAHYPLDALAAEDLMGRADQAMFESKRAGRCRIRLLNGAAPAQEIDLSALRRGTAARAPGEREDDVGGEGPGAPRGDRSHAD